MEWRPADGRCLPLLIFPCTIKSRSSLLATAHPGSPIKKAVKRLCVCVCVFIDSIIEYDDKLSLTTLLQSMKYCITETVITNHSVGSVILKQM